MYNSLTNNLGQLLQLYCLHGQSPGKLVRTFLHQIQSDDIFLVSLSALLKNLVVEFVEESEYETISGLFNQQQQQQQQQNISMASTCTSFSQFDKNCQNERRQKLGYQLRQSEWKVVTDEWLFLLSLALQRPIELSYLRENKLEQTLLKSKKMVVSPVVFNNKINILQLAPSVFTNRTNRQSLPTYYLLLMNESELNVSTQESSKKIEELVDLQLNEEVNFKYLLKYLNQQPVSQSSESDPTLPILLNQFSPQQGQLNEQPIKDRDNYMEHSNSSQLGSHLNSVQDSNRMFTLSPQPMQPKHPQQQQIFPEQLQQKSIPTYSPDPKLSLGEAFGRFILGATNTNSHKQAASYLNHQSDLVSANPTDDSNRIALSGKVKDMLFKLNNNSEQLNHLAKFPLSTSTATDGSSNPTIIIGLQSKENFHPKSRLKYKSVLYPINKQPSNSLNYNPTSTLASFPFNQYLPQSPPAPAHRNSGYSSPFGISLNSPGMGISNNNNTNYSSGNNNNIPGNNFEITNLTSEPRQQQHHNSSTMKTNQIGSLSPTPSLGQNNQLTNSSHNSNNNSAFTSSFSKAASNNKNTPHSFLGVGNFAFSSLGSMNIGGNGPSSLSAAGSFKRHHPNTNYHNMNYNTGKTDQQQRDILNQVSPRQNLNTQY